MNVDWNRELYRRELLTLIKRAVAHFAIEHPEFAVYTATVYTSGNGARSHIAFDDYENSQLMVRRLQRLFPDEPFDRNWNSADFTYPVYDECKHKSVPKNWEAVTDGACWAEITPCGIEVVHSTIPLFRVLNLHPDARLAAAIFEDAADEDWPLNR